jgi:hypothetical protein
MPELKKFEEAQAVKAAVARRLVAQGSDLQTRACSMLIEAEALFCAGISIYKDLIEELKAREVAVEVPVEREPPDA